MASSTLGLSAATIVTAFLATGLTLGLALLVLTVGKFLLTSAALARLRGQVCHRRVGNLGLS